MTRLLLALFLLLLTLHPAPARDVLAQVRVTAGSLLDDCQSDDHEFCVGYIVAVADSVSALSGEATVYGNRACIPPSLRNGEMRQVVADYLSDNKWVWSYGAASVVARVLAERFPCR